MRFMLINSQYTWREQRLELECQLRPALCTENKQIVLNPAMEEAVPWTDKLMLRMAEGRGCISSSHAPKPFATAVPCHDEKAHVIWSCARSQELNFQRHSRDILSSQTTSQRKWSHCPNIIKWKEMKKKSMREFRLDRALLMNKFASWWTEPAWAGANS